ncbi:hypothetical protein DYB35_009790 [Aphanomyces astaci]|uniref:DDE Tnp4 domain-containing protein n=1 Tax=Aphanomyces astaci TaxID=112090 RepID=A0A418DK65_APHAT|nr:hypothetical protein DYB35_009790 [Aphanomyces astaci]
MHIGLNHNPFIPINNMDPFAVVNRLQQDIEDENINLEEMSQVYREHTQQVEDTNDSPKPLIDRFYLQGGNASLTTMINLGGCGIIHGDDDPYVNPLSITQQVAKGTVFGHYPVALYAIDVNFLPSYHATGGFDEAKHYLSGNHKLFGLKLECSIAYSGVSVDLLDDCPGSVADSKVFMRRKDVHDVMLKASDSELDMPDNDEGVDR